MRLRLLALLAPVLLIPIIACEDSSSPSAGFTPDAGPGFEAGPSPEGGPVPDSAPPPVPGPVTVTVRDGAAAKQDVRVIFHDATGAVIGDQKTDASGKATFAKAPSMVTVLTLKGSATNVTFLGVEAGDQLTVLLQPTAVAPTPAGSLAVSFDAAFPGATNYGVQTGGFGCANQTNDPTLPLVLPLHSGCAASASVVLAIAGATSGDVLAYGFAKNVAKPPVGGSVNVGPIAFTATGATTIVATNVPPPGALQSLTAIANETIFSVGPASGSLTAGGVSYATATGFAEAYQSSVYVDGLGVRSHRAFLRRDGTTAPAAFTLPAFDFANALPEITDVTIEKTDPARAVVTLVSAAPLTAADGGLVRLVWSNVTSSGRWSFIVPPTVTSFKAPALPADATAFTPPAEVEAEGAAFFESTLVANYKEVRGLPVSTNASLGADNTSRPLPKNGLVRATQWTGSVD
jgi:hypothetical protein